MPKSFLGDIFGGLRDGFRANQHAAATLTPASSASGVRSSFRNPFITEHERELNETKRLYDEVRSAFEASPYNNEDAFRKFLVDIVFDVSERLGFFPLPGIALSLDKTARQLTLIEGSLYGFPEINFSAQFTLEEGIALRNYLSRKRRFLTDHERLTQLWRQKIIAIFHGVLDSLPRPLITYDPEDDAEDADSGTLSASLIDVCADPALVLERTIATFFTDDVVNARLFDSVREQLELNICNASGVPFERRLETAKALTLPTEADGLSHRELVDTYFAGTPLPEFFATPLPFTIPDATRLEHTLIVGGSGHGKTQLMQLLIHNDLVAGLEDGRSIIVIDSQGDFVRSILDLEYFRTTRQPSLADRLLIIDPTDVEYPTCLNVFDWNRERVGRYGATDREKILNGTIELYEYLFGALLGAELTQKQGVVFKYLARLMLEIPGATVQTLRALMENGEPFRPYMQKLPGSARSFFETRFFDRTFNETKKQILTRLWGVLSNATFERMFSHPRNKVDVFEAINGGKVILINTAKDLLKKDGCAIFGRFFIALIAQAALERAAVPSRERRATFVYIDEAQEYFDDNIDNLLTQARKYGVGMVLAHQTLDQLSTELRASVMANTSVKFAGGVSAKDAAVFAREMRCEPEFVHGMPKGATETKFACYVRNLTPRAIGVTVPLGHLGNIPHLTDAEREALIAANRARYCAPVVEITEELERTYAAPGPPPAPVRQKATGTGAPVASRGIPPRAVDAWPTMRQPEGRPSGGPAPESKGHRTSPTEPARVARPKPPSVPVEVASPARQPEALPPDEPVATPTIKLPPTPGRGGDAHKYLQHFVRQLAEQLGYRATLEEMTPDGAGRVDVALVDTDGGRRIACEISITTSPEHELANITKCFAAGYDHVVVIGDRAVQLQRIRKFVTANLDHAASGRVFFFVPSEFETYLRALGELPPPAEKMVGGRKVRTKRRVASAEETAARKEAIAKVIARRLQRTQDDKSE